MRSMALASAPVCSLVLVLKLANCSLLAAACGRELVTWFALCLAKSNTILNAKWCVHICALAVKLSPTATARRLCLYACLWRALKRARFDEFKRHIPKRRSEYKLD